MRCGDHDTWRRNSPARRNRLSPFSSGNCILRSRLLHSPAEGPRLKRCSTQGTFSDPTSYERARYDTVRSHCPGCPVRDLGGRQFVRWWLTSDHRVLGVSFPHQRKRQATEPPSEADDRHACCGTATALCQIIRLHMIKYTIIIKRVRSTNAPKAGDILQKRSNTWNLIAFARLLRQRPIDRVKFAEHPRLIFFSRWLRFGRPNHGNMRGFG